MKKTCSIPSAGRFAATFRHAAWAGSLLVLMFSPFRLYAHSSVASEMFEQTAGYNFVGAWAATGSYSVNDVVSYGGSLYIDTVATAPATITTTSGGGTNLFNKADLQNDVVIIAANGGLFAVGGFQSSGFVNLGGASSFVTNVTMNVFDPYGIAFYDSNRSFIGGSLLAGNGAFAAGVPVAVPAGGRYVRFWWQNGRMGTTVDAAIVDAGNTLQSSYTAFGVGGSGGTTTTTTPAAAPTDTTHWAAFTASPVVAPAAPVAASTATGPWVGKKMFMLGDSILWDYPAVAGQIAATIGAVPSSVGATAPGIDGFPGRTFASFMNGQSGSLKLPLAATVISDVDLMVIALGTNQDSYAGIGSVGDAPSLNGSMSAEMRAMLETIMGWKPGMRIIVVGPYQSNSFNVQAGTDGILGSQDAGKSMANAGSIAVLRNINNAMKAVCNLYAIPYVDMFNESGVNFSTSALWLKDGLHPNPLGYGSFYAPYIAAQLNRIAP